MFSFDDHDVDVDDGDGERFPLVQDLRVPMFGSNNHDVDVDDGDGERFPPIQDLRVPTTVMKGLCNGREQEREKQHNIWRRGRENWEKRRNVWAQ